MGIRPEHRVLGKLDIQDVHLAVGAGGRVADSLGPAVEETAFRVTINLDRFLFNDKDCGIVNQSDKLIAAAIRDVEFNGCIVR